MVLGDVHIIKAVWNPRQRPHATMRMKVTLNRKLTHRASKCHVIFYDSKDRVVARVPFYLAAGTFRFKTKKGMKVEFYGNPKIHTLKGAVRGVLVGR